MDTRYLQSFVAVVEHGSFAEAARRLGLTPAAIAARVKALEEFIDTPLVKRSGRTVLPTQSGLRILNKANAVVRDVRDLSAVAHDDSLLGELRLGVSSSALTGLLPPILERLYAAHPHLKIFVEPGTSSHLYRRIVSGDLDAGIIVAPQFAIPKAFAWQVLAEERFIVLAPAAMANRDPHDLLASEPFIRYDRGMWGGMVADRYLHEHNIVPQERLEIDALNAIATMVDRGIGVSLIPDWTPPWPEGLRVARLPLPGRTPIRQVGFLWSPRGSHAALAQAFLASVVPLGVKKKLR
ncbi:LysR family transcriptional regulator [Cupriavidus sp. TA19]|uniref:LysR family transcriptional regulator n=1 Tax=unclassified Cupriavidus TaxID=2640874 RepID=UPI000E2F8720|nr:MULTISPECIES: LysR family transcriptional regulator [unclassified Cupriavidus]BDB29591.1 LysR family transcriptional regulator [Cupriavidus sp. P-10]GLC97438.1 LysR family transcriptional regulator [Cupriavidus sp. TA19]